MPSGQAHRTEAPLAQDQDEGVIPMAKDTQERTYTIPLRKAILKVPRYKRAKRAMSEIRIFLKRHLKVETVKIGQPGGADWVAGPGRRNGIEGGESHGFEDDAPRREGLHALAAC